MRTYSNPASLSYSGSVLDLKSFVHMELFLIVYVFAVKPV